MSAPDQRLQRAQPRLLRHPGCEFGRQSPGAERAPQHLPDQLFRRHERRKLGGGRCLFPGSRQPQRAAHWQDHFLKTNDVRAGFRNLGRGQQGGASRLALPFVLAGCTPCLTPKSWPSLALSRRPTAPPSAMQRLGAAPATPGGVLCDHVRESLHTGFFPACPKEISNA